MKTSVYNMMMSLALMGCMIFNASDAMAQGRNRNHGGSATSRSQSAAVSRPSNNTSAPTVSRNSDRPQSVSSSAPSRPSTVAPVSSEQRSQRGAVSRSNDRKSTTVRESRPSDNGSRPSVKPGNNRPGDHGSRPNVKPGNDRPGDHGNRPNVKPGNDRPGNHGNRPNVKPGNDRPGGMGNHHGYNPNHRYDYNGHHYRDQFSWNHKHHNWSRPLPPPVRAHRPAPIVWRRPVIPVGWRPYAAAPIIDRILGITFGSLYEASLEHLYYSGYYIDGYADGIIYLRDVPMLNLYWPDVLLNYDNGRLANAQFIFHSSYYDRGRFDRAYNSLCRIYGRPVFDDGVTTSWYGGNNTGWVTLTMSDNYGDYYTTMSIGY